MANSLRESHRYKHIKLKLSLVGAFIVFMIVATILQVTFFVPKRIKRNNKANEEYFYSFNESFSGIIISKNTTIQSKGHKHLMLIKLRLNRTTINYYDSRGSLKYFFCVIDSPYIELLFDDKYFNWIEPGDSCDFDGIYDSLGIYKNTADGTFFIRNKPDIISTNNKYLDQFFTIKKENKDKKTIISHPNNYFMLLFGRFKNKKNLSHAIKTIANRKSRSKEEIPKYIEKKQKGYYWFYDKSRYGNYEEVLLAWKKSGFNELFIAKFDKYNNFIKILEKTKGKK